MKKEATQKIVEDYFSSWFIPALSAFVRVQNLTPMVDKEYLTNGLVEESIQVVDDHIQKLEIKGLTRSIF